MQNSRFFFNGSEKPKRSVEGQEGYLGRLSNKFFFLNNEFLLFFFLFFFLPFYVPFILFLKENGEYILGPISL